MAAEEGEIRMDEMCFDVVAVLPAGGCGVRMNMELPKQFYQIMGRPLISYTLEAFESVSWIKEIVVPVSENYLKDMQQVLSEFTHTKVRLTCGGRTRHRSIWNGIQALTMDGRSPPSVVILHDAVRPFVDEQTVRNVTIAAKKHGAAGVIRPLASTVIAQSSDGFLDHSLDRSKFRSSEMPQAFQYEVIKKAYEQCTEDDFEHGTECLHLAQKYAGTRALLIDGPESLWKVTYRKDLYSVEGVLRGSCHKLPNSHFVLNSLCEVVTTSGCYNPCILTLTSACTEKQDHLAVIVGKGFPSYLDVLNEHLRKRDVEVRHLSDLSLEEEHSQIAKQFASEINTRLMASTGCVSVVSIVDNARSDEKPSSESCIPDKMRCVLQEITQKCNPCLVKRLRLVTVSFSNSRKDFKTLKMATREVMSCLIDQGVVCLGVFVCTDLENQKDEADMSKLMEKAAELTTSAILDVPPVLNGQTFDTIT